jgi:Tfp pilus assembly protein PilN
MKQAEMNLASRPFANEQPVIRSSVLLWILGLALLVLNITLYYRHIEGKGELQELLRETDERLIEETDSIERLRGELGQLDLERQNEQVTFLNAQIALRIFSWSALFDRLAEVVPAAIQMKGISPNIVAAEDADPRGRRGDSSAEIVKVDLQGTTRSPEAVLELVDALFAHPSFFDPDLTRESFADGQDNSFSLSVFYLPGRAGEEVFQEGPLDTMPAEAEAAPVDAGEESDQDPVTQGQVSMEDSE